MGRTLITGEAVRDATISLVLDVTGTLPIGNGGTGQITQQLAINALTNVAAATNEYVLTKDTGSGNAIFKVAAAGGGLDRSVLVYLGL